MRYLAGLVTAFAVGFSALSALAQESQESYVRLDSVWKPGQQINVESGAPAVSTVQPGWQSAQWVLEPVNQYFRIKNRWKGTYLHTENGSLEIGPVQPNWFSAMWEFEPVGNGVFRIKNPYRKTYLNIETGRLQLGDVQPGWLSAQWRKVPVAQQAAPQPRQQPAQQPAQPAKPSIGAPVGSAAANAALRSPGKQCVKAIFGVGYAARVRWYDPLNVMLDPATKKLSIRPGAAPEQNEKISVLQTSCIQRQRKMVAQVTVLGAEFANEAVTIAASTALAVAFVGADAVICVGTAGAGCGPAIAVTGALAGGAISAVGASLPDAKETFYVGSPGKLEIGGTVWKPWFKEVRKFAEGKPPGASCSADGDCLNNTCARDSAREGNRSICCPSGKESMYAGYEYCNGLKKGKVCWSDAMCASGNCKGNMSGMRRGKCS